MIASVALVAASIALFGVVCYSMVGAGSLDRLGIPEAAALAAIIALGLGAGWLSMGMGMRGFRRQEF